MLGLFIAFPLAATVVGLLCIAMYLHRRAVVSLITGLCWITYSIYEFLIYARVLCTGECNIRIDLLILYPILFLMLIASLIAYFRRRNDNPE